MKDFLRITKALADAHRVRVLLALRAGELCACQITALAGLAPSTVSRHLSLLQLAGLIEARKQGRWVHFRLAGDGAPAAVRDAIRWTQESLEQEPRVNQDAAAVRRILKQDPAELCRLQAARSSTQRTQRNS